MKKKVFMILILLLLVAGAILLLKTRKANLAQAPVAAALPVVVDAISVQPQEIILTLPAMGVVSSDISTTLSTKISGRIDQIFKREGAAVKPGELIARIDSSEFEAKRKALLAKIEGLDSEISVQRESHQRTLELFRVGGASLEQKQKEEAAIDRLEQERLALRQNIKEVDNLAEYARIVAPVSGTLSARLVKAGDLALPGKPLFKIAANEGLYLDLRLPSDLQADAIRYGKQRFALTAKNQAGASGLREYRATLPLGKSLVEGEFLNVDLVLYSGKGVLLPNDVLLSTEAQTYVLIYRGGKVEKTPVTLTHRGSQGVMVEENLSGKTLLLAKPDILLRATSGAPVKILSRDNS